MPPNMNKMSSRLAENLTPAACDRWGMAGPSFRHKHADSTDQTRNTAWLKQSAISERSAGAAFSYQNRPNQLESQYCSTLRLYSATYCIC
ncbi:hypothetical protein PoB_002912400 [Plakobranchus ocellatus]|uniref:Uncharacterized protein n=1 Tax=Plakobranchus ocellatus TaxID=259542 RepID=A0AAV4A7X5_9GAST|nr:hypothetical protein PoB_002912400 [Plakobranchus ocellatus]